MKKFFISAGLAAAGAVGLHAENAPDAGDGSRLWSVSASLRGFYDDNYTTAHTGAQSSVGAELKPTFSLNLPMAQTELGIRYTYGLYYYQRREDLGQNPIDQTHQFDLWLDHMFNPRWHAKVQESFVVAQEPELLTPGAVSLPQRVEGNNIVNTAKITLDTDWTRLFSTELGYENTFYDYQQNGGTAAAPSLAGLLNRDENLASIDLKWNVKPTTIFLVGYQYDQTIYIGNEQVAQNPLTGQIYYSSVRDSLSHSVYVGANHAFRENLSGNVKIGVEYSESYNDPSSPTSVGPYLDASLVDTFASGSYVQIGATHSRNASSVIAVNTTNGRVTQDQESSVVYASVNYQATKKLTASAVAHFQYATYNQGQFNNQSDEYYSLGLDLSYAFNHHFSAEMGYNFDDLTSAISAQNYTRDRYYLGLTASY